MPEVRGPTLMMAIQAVDDKVQGLVARLDAADPDAADVTDLEDELLRYEKAASELKVAYEAAVKMASNLPAYDTLVK
ncbi:MAG: hypothetical protein ACJ8G1_05425 [Vitreoscilla sp.]